LKVKKKRCTVVHFHAPSASFLGSNTEKKVHVTMLCLTGSW